MGWSTRRRVPNQPIWAFAELSLSTPIHMVYWEMASLSATRRDFILNNLHINESLQKDSALHIRSATSLCFLTRHYLPLLLVDHGIAKRSQRYVNY